MPLTMKATKIAMAPYFSMPSRIHAQHAARRGVGLGEDGAGKGDEQGGTHGRSIGTARWAQTKEGRPWGRPSRSGRLLRRGHFASVGMRMP